MTIPALMEQYGLASIDFLKLDIEGGECRVLDESAREWLPLCAEVSTELHDDLNPESSRTVLRRFLEFPQFSCRAQGELLVFCNRQRLSARP